MGSSQSIFIFFLLYVAEIKNDPIDIECNDEEVIHLHSFSKSPFNSKHPKHYAKEERQSDWKNN